MKSNNKFSNVASIANEIKRNEKAPLGDRKCVSEDVINKKQLRNQNEKRLQRNSLKGPQRGLTNNDKAADMDGIALNAFQNMKLGSTDKKDLGKPFQKSELNAYSAHGGLEKYKDTKWASLGINGVLEKNLIDSGHSFPSPVQALTIPHAIKGRDMMVRAKNGTGKTASFVIPILNQTCAGKGLQAVVLVPTRELALQISKVFMTFGQGLGIRIVPLVGGDSLADDVLRLTSAPTQVIIGTPGSTLDLLGKRLCPMEQTITVVFDEADKLLDALFYNSVSLLLKIFPKNRQTLLYSATFPQSIEGFERSCMQNPLKIKVDEQNLSNVKQFLAIVKSHTKLPCLKSLLTTLCFDQCIIYCNTIKSVKNLAEKITELGMSAYFIYSSMDQGERNIVYHNFSKKKFSILVSTDITTRGINIPGVNLVINFDMPGTSESYLHRVGRAGRFGKKGCAINFLLEDELRLANAYEKALGVTILPISDNGFKEFIK